MTFLDAIDNPLLVFLYAGLALFSIAHMNKMYYRHNATKMEAAAWWFLGVGAFAVAWFDVNALTTEWGHIMFGIGAALLVGVHTRHEWRPFVANRRSKVTIEPSQERRATNNHGEQAHG